MSKYRPIHDRVLVIRENVPTTSASGLIVATTLETKSDYARVIAVGPGIENSQGVFIPTNLRPGDRVLLGKTSSDGRGAHVFEEDGEEYAFVREGDIVALVQD